MDILSQLETKIESLLLRTRSLEADNRRMKDESVRGQSDLKAEITRLREELEREQSAKEEVRGRIDGLLQRLQDETI
ncbi:MAG: cell division protein ZapB [Proteobacteria bacterium]|nr:cell division protein ZapB [Pseudomonadota bacterium]